MNRWYISHHFPATGPDNWLPWEEGGAEGGGKGVGRGREGVGRGRREGVGRGRVTRVPICLSIRS